MIQELLDADPTDQRKILSTMSLLELRELNEAFAKNIKLNTNATALKSLVNLALNVDKHGITLTLDDLLPKILEIEDHQLKLQLVSQLSIRSDLRNYSGFISTIITQTKKLITDFSVSEEENFNFHQNSSPTDFLGSSLKSFEIIISNLSDFIVHSEQDFNNLIEIGKFEPKILKIMQCLRFEPLASLYNVLNWVMEETDIPQLQSGVDLLHKVVDKDNIKGIKTAKLSKLLQTRDNFSKEIILKVQSGLRIFHLQEFYSTDKKYSKEVLMDALKFMFNLQKLFIVNFNLEKGDDGFETFLGNDIVSATSINGETMSKTHLKELLDRATIKIFLDFFELRIKTDVANFHYEMILVLFLTLNTISSPESGKPPSNSLQNLCLKAIRSVLKSCFDSKYFQRHLTYLPLSLLECMKDSFRKSTEEFVYGKSKSINS